MKVRPGNDKSVNHDGFSLHVESESWRFYAYLFFWGMCAFAIFLARVVVKPILLDGPADGSTCPPYSRDDPTLGVSPGKGFNIDTQSHLMELFGYNNICVHWDYSPSRELTAMVYPLFEYSLIVYLVLDFVVTKLAYQRGELSDWFYKVSKIMLGINIFLCSQFRMIFVCLAYINVKHHTAGFLGLQVALMFVALSNTYYIIDSKVAYKALGGLKNTRMLAIAYLIGDIFISFFKIKSSIYAVQVGMGAAWTLAPSGIAGKNVGEVLDLVWMIFNAVIPLAISYFRKTHDEAVTITFTQEKPTYIESGDEPTEETPLRL